MVKVVAQKEVVEQADDAMSQTQISLEDARNISASYQPGDIVNVEVTPRDFGRIAANDGKAGNNAKTARGRARNTL